MNTDLGKFDVPEDLWKMIEPLIPKHEKIAYNGGRPRLDDRIALAGILYRIRTGISWRYLPPMFGTKSAVHRRFQEWVEAGVFDKIHKETLKFYDKKKGIRTKRMAADGSHARAPKGGFIPEEIQRIVVKRALKGIS